MSRRDDDDDGSKGGRSSRIRKKSAKVLEMEEFEEIEKKQFSKKGDPKGKGAVTPPGIPAKKMKGKGSEDLIPAIPALQPEALSTGIVLPGPSVAQTPGVSLSPVKASTKQAIGAKVREGQGSVIKLLLSSPTIPTTPSVSTNVITKTSPPVSVSSSTASIISAPAPTTKKGTVKIKAELPLKQDIGDIVSEEEVMEGIPVKTELMDSKAANLMLAATLTQGALSPQQGILTSPQAVIKPDPSAGSSEGLSSLKLKLMLSPKDTTPLESAVPTSSAIHNMLLGNTETLESTTSPAAGSGAAKKKAAPKRKKPAEKKPAKQPATISAAEQMPNLAALVSTPKLQKSMKEEPSISMSDGMDTSMSDTSLDMNSIVESALDMEEEAALVIAEGAPSPAKPKKKRASGGSKKKKAAALDMAGLDMGTSGV